MSLARWLAGRRFDARVNLAGRSALRYPLLIGRDVLVAGRFLVDPAEEFMHVPQPHGNSSGG